MKYNDNTDLRSSLVTPMMFSWVCDCWSASQISTFSRPPSNKLSYEKRKGIWGNRFALGCSWPWQTCATQTDILTPWALDRAVKIYLIHRQWSQLWQGFALIRSSSRYMGNQKFLTWWYRFVARQGPKIFRWRKSLTLAFQCGIATNSCFDNLPLHLNHWGNWNRKSVLLQLPLIYNFHFFVKTIFFGSVRSSRSHNVCLSRS